MFTLPLLKLYCVTRNTFVKRIDLLDLGCKNIFGVVVKINIIFKKFRYKKHFGKLFLLQLNGLDKLLLFISIRPCILSPLEDRIVFLLQGMILL